MAIVKSEQTWVDGKSFTRKFKCDSGGDFSCALPDYVAEDLGINKNIDGSTLLECAGAWKEAVQKYEMRTTVVNKVIAFEFTTEVSFSSGISLCVSAAVLEETIVTHRDSHQVHKYKAINSEMDYSLRRGFDRHYRLGGKPLENVIPWSVKSEMFFNDLAGAMGKLIEKLESLSGTDALLEFVSSGQKLLGSTSHQVTLDEASINDPQRR
jgi:hypothetical protein